MYCITFQLLYLFIFRQHKEMKSIKYVPTCSTPLYNYIEHIGSFIKSCKRLLILTGAGVSTESGIPDYRSEGVGLYARKFSGPMQYQTFLKSAKDRQRYWARNFAGWPSFSSKLPNDNHLILAKWEHTGSIFYTITQNVDNLHTTAGSKLLIELHGSTHRVICLSCDYRVSRHEFQIILQDLNHHFVSEMDSEHVNPDGDVVLHDNLVKLFQFPNCPVCNGILKPDVIFFGDNVPRSRKEFISGLVHSCDGLLCMGTSLHTFSSFRIAQEAHALHKPIGIVNIGITRADQFATLKLKARLGYVVPQLDEIISKC